MNRFRSGLTALVPDGWLARESIQFASAEGDTVVFASADFLPAGTTVEQFAEQYAEQLGQHLPEYKQLDVDNAQLSGGRSAIVRRFRWAPPDAEALTEIQVYTIENGRGVVATARAPEKRFDELEPHMRELLAGIGVAGPRPGGGIVRREESARARTYEAFEAGQLSTTPASAFGLEPTNGNPEAKAADEVSTVWGDMRSSWRQEREEL
jgi:hypothetical protein